MLEDKAEKFKSRLVNRAKQDQELFKKLDDLMQIDKLLSIRDKNFIHEMAKSGNIFPIVKQYNQLCLEIARENCCSGESSDEMAKWLYFGIREIASEIF